MDFTKLKHTKFSIIVTILFLIGFSIVIRDIYGTRRCELKNLSDDKHCVLGYKNNYIFYSDMDILIIECDAELEDRDENDYVTCYFYGGHLNLHKFEASEYNFYWWFRIMRISLCTFVVNFLATLFSQEHYNF